MSRLAFALSLLLAVPAVGQGRPRIEDNSFLLEEAYNQERGVVQHISTFSRPKGTGEWGYALTTEWPVTGQRHQLSYTVNVLRADGPGGLDVGLGDLAVNYRFQALGGEGARLWLAPRVTTILPLGNAGSGRGNGRVGVEIGLPASITLTPWLTSHLNAGLTLFPDASGTGRLGTVSRASRLGGSLIADVSSRVNILVETLYETRRQTTGGGGTVLAESWVINPGVRWAHDFKSGLQIVPGVAYTIGAGPSTGDDGLFAYLSFEYPFKR